MILNIYVPREGRLTHIVKGSGIVGYETDVDVHTAAASGRGVVLYYEGNLYDAENLREWAARVRHAAERCIYRSPTIARCLGTEADVTQIGLYDTGNREPLIIVDGPALALWLAPAVRA